ncbi:MAG TPA: hypothetical protein VNJ11_16565 [Bryobacteraceae bacterium]|nr:hypothetical protein [Bryobacteraceae bacterium]
MSFKLTQLIQEHGKQRRTGRMAGAQAVAQLQHAYDSLRPESRELLDEIVARLGAWFALSDVERLRVQCRRFGRLCFVSSIPLHQAVRIFHVVKRMLSASFEDQGWPPAALERLGSLIDELVCDVVRGYEEALMDAAERMPMVCRLLLPAAIGYPAKIAA